MKQGHAWLAIAPVLIALAAALAFGGMLARAELAQGSTIFVDADAAGANDGSSWEDAYTALQSAMEEAAEGDQIWVAEGVYTPTYESTPGDPRSATFQLKNGVALYGGFDPTLGDVGWEDRDWVNHGTVLSGDLGSVGDPGDNSYHVFYHPSELALDGSAVLDGFTVTGGNADGDSPDRWGGGMKNVVSSPTVSHCTFSANWAEYGGGMLNHSSSPAVTNCTFSGNSSTWFGGGMLNMYSSSPTVTNCAFSGNSSLESHGGGMCNVGSSPPVTNCTFSGNLAAEGGGMSNTFGSAPPVTNSILWGDSLPEIANEESEPAVTYSDVQGGYEGVGNIDADPLFVDQAGGDFHLGPGSPCIDTGTNDAPNLPPYDFEGDPRVVDGDRDGIATVEMGVDEVHGHAVYLPIVLRSY
ncbi:MAG TPA: right-handed parallel beta-helix repeat-containing protein [Anaerolineae bacterium]|nr:right-handed parallel beta-helix repeat-containing protein [Anaerolineae bacterium]